MSLEEQIDRFKKGFPDVKLVAAATVGGGIKQVASGEEIKFVEKYESASISCEKFVPRRRDSEQKVFDCKPS